MAKQTISVWILRHNDFAKAIGMAVIGMVLLLVIFVPSISKISELNQKIKIRSKEEVVLTNKVRVINGMDKDALSSRLEILDQALPPRKDVVLYLATVDGLSRELGLSFAGISLSPGDVTEASASSKTRAADIVKGVHVLETEIKINGSKEKIYEFLRVLESTSPLMQIKDVQVSSLGVTEDSYALALRLGMLWASRDVGDTSGVVELFTEKEEGYFQELAQLRKFDSSISFLEESKDQLGKFDLFATIPLQLENQQQEPQELVQE